MRCFPVPQLHGTCWPAAALPGAQQALASALLSTLHFSRLLIHSIHLVLGVGQYVFWFSLFCIAAVFQGPPGCHLTGTLALHQASSPSLFPSEHQHASSSPPPLPRPRPFWTLAAFLTQLFSEPLPHPWLVCTPHNLRSLSACFTPMTVSYVWSHLDLVTRSQL